MTENNIQLITDILKKSAEYKNDQIEASVIKYVSEKTKKQFCFDSLNELAGKENDQLLEIFETLNFPVDIEFIIEFFEALLEKENINENGIVFTPKYIADYIAEKAFENHMNTSDAKAVDPGCGCGIFLISFSELLHKKFGKSYVDIFNDNIYGLEMDPDNARRCIIVINLWSLINGEDNVGLKANIKCVDSLKNDWSNLFSLEGFDYIIGNPPYVNTHDMTKETAKFLKNTFLTTKTGVYNIFYAFIEHGMQFLNENAVLSYIIPNNFLTIKAATDLRAFLSDHTYMESVLDFADNMVFKPVRTYNCIIRLSKQPKKSFEYCVMNKVDDIEASLSALIFDDMPFDKLDVNGWKLVDRVTMSNIQKIESQFRSIKEFVRTGIATLRDDVYMVDKDSDGYYKIIDGVRYSIEGDLVKRLYKIPDLKNCEDIKNSCRYIIFPYRKKKAGFEIIPEEELKANAPGIYEYLLMQKYELDKRDKGKPNPVAWYAYGRTQGLNKFGNKLVFPTFAFIPRFTMIDDEYALFCNGYAVFENDYLELDILQRILNSSVMQYYVSNTSYSIEGEYFCYQKKYIEKFSIPYFDEAEKCKIRNMSDEELNEHLIQLYDLNVD